MIERRTQVFHPRPPLGVTLRRSVLDSDLAAATRELRGTVLDIGGEQKGQRGVFRPPATLAWISVNTNIGAGPSIVGDAFALPVKDNSVDHVVMCETLEHLADPERAVREAHRVLRVGGSFILSVPFMARYHPDPHDYGRHTESALRLLLEKASLVNATVRSQGGYWSLVYDLAGQKLARLRFRSLARLILSGLWWILRRRITGEREGLSSDFERSFVTGYFVTAWKK